MWLNVELRCKVKGVRYQSAPQNVAFVQVGGISLIRFISLIIFIRFISMKKGES